MFQLKNFVRTPSDETGSAVVEYALLAGLLAVALIPVLGQLSGSAEPSESDVPIVVIDANAPSRDPVNASDMDLPDEDMESGEID